MDITLDEHKKISLEVLDEINRVCNELNLEYFLAYGTLIGAVRHKGIIPWDDDIDIWMKRKDYEILMDNFNKICSKDYKLLSYHFDEQYPFLPPKVVSLKTNVVEKLMKPITDLGVWVDIFPLDYSTDNDEAKCRAISKLEHKRWMALYNVSTIGAKIKLFFYNLIQRDTKFTDRNTPPGVFSKQINSISANCEYANKISSPSSDVDKTYWFDSEDFEKSIIVPFEDREYPIPIGYDKILKTRYGNYLTPPPIRAQKRDKHLKSAKWKTSATQT